MKHVLVAMLLVHSVLAQSSVVGGGGGITNSLPPGGVGGSCSNYSATYIYLGVLYTCVGTPPASGVWTAVGGSNGTSAKSPFLTLDGTNYMGPIYAVTRPPACSTLTWVNQGGSTCTTTTNNSIVMTAPAVGSDSIRFLHTAAYPSTTFTFTIGMIIGAANADAVLAGIGISDGTKFAVMGQARVSSFGQGFYTFTSSTSGGTQFTQVSLLPSEIWFVQFIDDGTNFTVKAGPSIDTLQTFTSTTRSATGITPTQLGIAIDTSTSLKATTMQIFHWQVQ